MTIIILSILLFVFVCISIFEFFVIRGAITTEKNPEYEKLSSLTGVETEEIRRKVVAVGLNAITQRDVLNLIKTIVLLKVGLNKDTDVYVPSEAYKDIKK